MYVIINSVLQQPEVIDDDEDPDYNFLLSDTEDANDCEDFRTDPAVSSLVSVTDLRFDSDN